MSIKLKSLLLLLLSALIPLIILSFVAYRISSNSLERSIEAQMVKALEDATSKVDTYFLKRQKFFDELVKNDDFLLWIQNRDSGKDIRFLYELFTASFKYLMKKQGITLGLAIYSGDTRIIELNVIQDVVYETGIFGNSDIYIKPDYYALHKKVEWADVVLYESTTRLKKLLKQLNLKGSKTFKGFLYFPSTETVLNGGILNQQLTQLSRAILKEKNELFIKTNGAEYRIVGQTKGDYFVGVMISKDEYMKPIKRLRAAIILIVLATTVVIVLISLFVSRVLTSPILQIAEIAKKIALGNYDVEVGIKRDDELGVLAASFEHMRKKVKDTINSLDKQISDLTTLYDLSNEIREHKDILEVLGLVMETLNVGFDIRKAAVLLKEYNEDIYSLAAQEGLDEQTILNLRLDGKIVRELTDTKEPKVADNKVLDKIRTLVSAEFAPQISNVIIVPLVVYGDLIGVVFVFDYGEEDISSLLKYLGILASQLSSTIFIAGLNEELKEITKQAFDIVLSKIEDAIANAKKYNMPVTFVKLRLRKVLEISEYNQLKSQLYNILEQTDKVYRVGFKELLLVFSGKEGGEAKKVLSTLKKSIDVSFTAVVVSFPENANNKTEILQKLKV